jgi:peptide/nickel transport system substrate-binding protein
MDPHVEPTAARQGKAHDASTTKSGGLPAMNDIPRPGPGFSRRQVLKTAATSSLALGGAGLLASCGGSSPGTSPAGTGGEPQRGGMLRIGLTGGATSDTFDPHITNTFPDYARAALLFEGLLGTDAGGRPSKLLAKEFSANSAATEWTIRVHEGIQFHNGKELTADDVLFTFRRILDPKEPKYGASSLERLDLSGAKKLDKYTLRIPMSKPFAIFDQILSGNFVAGYAEFAIVPQGFDPKHPVGTGAFKYGSFSPNDQTVVNRNENYWKKGLPYLDGVTITEYPDEASQVNALIGGQESAINSVSIGSLAQLESSGLQPLISNSGMFIPLAMRVDLEPFSDPRFTQGLKLAIDRKQILEQVFGGHGTIGNDVAGLFSAEYDHSLPQREQDIEQAKSLLKQAGKSSVQLELLTAPVAQGAVQLTEVFAQQVSEAGIDVKLKKGTVTELFGSNFLHWPFFTTFWLGVPYLGFAALSSIAGAPYPETHFNNPQYTQLYEKALSTVDLAARKKVVFDMQQIEYDQGGFAIPFFAPIIDAHSSDVNNLMPTRSGLSLHDYVLSSVWLS